MLKMSIRWRRVPGLADWATGTSTSCSAYVSVELVLSHYPTVRRVIRRKDRYLLIKNPCGVWPVVKDLQVRGQCRLCFLDRGLRALAAQIGMKMLQKKVGQRRNAKEKCHPLNATWPRGRVPVTPSWSAIVDWPFGMMLKWTCRRYGRYGTPSLLLPLSPRD
jgi:hypothetical protein